MKRTRPLVAALVLASLCLALAGCAGSADTKKAAFPDDKLIAQKGDTYTAAVWHGSLPGEVVMDGFTGTATLLGVTVPEGGGELAVDYDQDVSAGDFKTVLVRYGETVEPVCEGTDGGQRTFALQAGDYAVKAVGLEASCCFSMEIGATGGVEAFVPGDAFDPAEPVALEPLEA